MMPFNPRWALLALHYEELLEDIAKILGLEADLLREALETLKQNTEEGIVLLRILGINIGKEDIEYISEHRHTLLNELFSAHWEQMKKHTSIVLELLENGYCPNPEAIRIAITTQKISDRIIETIIAVINKNPKLAEEVPETILINNIDKLETEIILALPTKYIDKIHQTLKRRYGDKIWAEIIIPKPNTIKNIVLLLMLAPPKIESFALRTIKTKIQLPEIPQEEILSLPQQYLYLLKISRGWVPLNKISKYLEQNTEKTAQLLDLFLKQKVKLEPQEIIMLTETARKAMEKAETKLRTTIEKQLEKTVEIILRENLATPNTIIRIAGATILIRAANNLGKLPEIIQQTEQWEPLIREYIENPDRYNPETILTAAKPYIDKITQQYPTTLIKLWIETKNKNIIKAENLMSALILDRKTDEQTKTGILSRDLMNHFEAEEIATKITILDKKPDYKKIVLAQLLLRMPISTLTRYVPVVREHPDLVIKAWLATKNPNLIDVESLLQSIVLSKEVDKKTIVSILWDIPNHYEIENIVANLDIIRRTRYIETSQYMETLLLGILRKAHPRILETKIPKKELLNVAALSLLIAKKYFDYIAQNVELIQKDIVILIINSIEPEKAANLLLRVRQRPDIEEILKQIIIRPFRDGSYTNV